MVGTDFPGVGDTATLTSTQTVTIPSGYDASSASITYVSGSVSNPTYIYVQGSLTTTGNIGMGIGSSGYSGIALSSGATLNMKGHNIVTNGNGFSYNYIHFEANSSSRAAVNWGGGTITGSGGGFNYLDVNWQYVNVSSMAAFTTGYESAGADFVVSHCLFDGSDQIGTPVAGDSTGANIYIEFSDFRNSTNGTPVRFYSNSTNIPTGRNEFVNNTIASDTFVTLQIDGRSTSIKNNILKNVYILINNANGSDTNEIVDSNVMVGMVAANASNYASLYGSITFNNNFVYSEGDNPHYFDGIGTHTYTNNIVETNTQGTISDDGDVYLGDGSAGNNGQTVSTGTFKNNLLIGHRASSCLLSLQGGAGVIDFTQMNNNTIYYDTTTTTSNFCFRVGETYAGKVNMFASVRNNLCVASLADANAHIISDLQIGTAQKISTAGTNGYYNMGSTLYQLAGTYGVGDVNANPSFVDSTRELLKWDTSIGGDGTSLDAINGLLKINGTGGTYNSAYSLAALMIYVKAGFVSQTQSLKGAGFDGSDIGAFPIAAASPSSSSSGGSSGFISGRPRFGVFIISK